MNIFLINFFWSVKLGTFAVIQQKHSIDLARKSMNKNTQEAHGLHCSPEKQLQSINTFLIIQTYWIKVNFIFPWKTV